MQKYSRLAVVALVVAAAMLAGWLLVRGRNNPNPGSSTANSQRPPQEQSKPPDDYVVTVEEFGDYQCPPCAELHPILKRLKGEFGVRLNLVFRNLPLSSIHKNALVAAQAAEAARMQNRFWEMHDLLYENQNLWKDEANPRPRFLKFARDLGLDTGRFAADMQSEQVQLRIQADRDAAVGKGIDGTPTVLINGRQLRPEATTYDGIRRGIEAMRGRGTASDS